MDENTISSFIEGRKRKMRGVLAGFPGTVRRRTRAHKSGGTRRALRRQWKDWGQLGEDLGESSQN